MEKKTNTPALRFRGFNGPWEKKKLGELGSLKNGMNFGKDAMDHGSPFVGIQDIFGKNVVDINHLGKAEATPNQQRDYNLKKGDVLFVRSSVKLEGVGECALIPKDLPQATYSGFTIRFRDEIGMNNDFKRYVFTTKNVRGQILSQATNSANKNISQPILSSLKISIPEIEEQKIIGNFFATLDEKTFAQEQKIKKLEQFRQAMLTKLFPAEGASEPALRFYGFSGPWVKRGLLENFTKIIDFRGRTPKKLGMDWSANGYPALSALNVKDGYIDFSQDVHFGSPELYEKWMVGNELHRGQVIFTTEAPMGNVAQIPDERKYILSQRTIAFEVYPALLTEDFLATLLRSPKVQKDLQALSSGGTAKGVSQRSMEMVDVVLPANIEEQKKIGDFFHRLDLYISLQKEKLEKMRLLKAALLDKLFV